MINETLRPKDLRLVLESDHSDNSDHSVGGRGLSLDVEGWGDFANKKFHGGEFVFSTSMTGIEESLTDPSYRRQVLVSTVSHVGNTGFTEEDVESHQIWAEGLIVRHLSEKAS